ncbi:hypothetical protein B0J13DRAFT_488411, partial [Dactylonectria estremocensis]
MSHVSASKSSSMSQCLLTFQNGFLGLVQPKRHVVRLQTTDDSEWVTSDLDDIRLDLFQSSTPEKLSRENNPNFSRRYRGQPRLVIPDNSVAIEKPQIKNDDANIERSPTIFLNLPVEVRLLIYRHLLITRGFPVLCPEPGGFRVLGSANYDATYNLHPQILATCRQINREGTSLLYSENVFRRQFFWRTIYTRSGKRLSPRWNSSPLKTANLESISRVRIFEHYGRWLSGKGELKVLQEFPYLRELQVRVDLGSDQSGADLDPELVLKHTLRAASNHPSRILLKIHLPFDEDFYSWSSRCVGGSLDFSLHRARKMELEAWMREKYLFLGRNMAWNFTTRVSEWCGPSCLIGLDVGGRSAVCPDTITCFLETDEGVKTTLEPI